MFFLSHCCQTPFHCCILRMPSNTVLVSGPAVGAAQTLIWSYSCVFLPPCPRLSEPVRFLLWELSMIFHIFHRHRVCLVDRVDLICSCTAGGTLWVFFFSHTAPGFQLWSYFHLCMWIVHWGLLLRLPWQAWVCPCEDQVWRCCSCLGRRGSGSTRCSGELAARAAGTIVL